MKVTSAASLASWSSSCLCFSTRCWGSFCWISGLSATI